MIVGKKFVSKYIYDALVEKAVRYFTGILNGVEVLSRTDSKTFLNSPLGIFSLIDYLVKDDPKIRTLVLFYNNKSGKVVHVYGAIREHYLNEVHASVLDVKDFPIEDEKPLTAAPASKISYFSNYTVTWHPYTNWITSFRYDKFIPLRPSTLIAYTEEHTISKVNFLNWQIKKDNSYNSKSRSFRNSGKASQILLHETAFLSDLTTPVFHDGYFAIPHFCVNNLDPAGKGNIIQFIDIAERTNHGELLNDRSVGIEFVNAPIQPNNKEGEKIAPFLDKSTEGVYLETVLFDTYSRLFIPLEFPPKDSKDEKVEYFDILIPKSSIVNYSSLEARYGAAAKSGTLKSSGSDVHLKCKSGKFEVLRMLVDMLVPLVFDPGKALSNPDMHKNVLTFEKNKVFLFDKSFVHIAKPKGVPDEFHYCIDVRQQGIFNHGCIGGHADGFMQALYIYIVNVELPNADHGKSLQRIIDLLVKGKVKRTVKPIAEFKTIVIAKTNGDELEPKDTPTVIKTQNYLVL